MMNERKPHHHNDVPMIVNEQVSQCQNDVPIFCHFMFELNAWLAGKCHENSHHMEVR